MGQHESLADYVSWHPDVQPEAILLPAVDVAAAINEDQRTGNPNNRFGLEIPLTLTEQDGDYTEMPDGSTIWTMKIRSAGATSLNFVFRNTQLPPHSEMYLYAAAEFMVMGPITATHVHEGIYATDVIYGEEVVIAVRMPTSQVGDFVLEVDEAVHGYSGGRDFGDSEDCNIDVNCSPMSTNQQLARDAVGLILYQGTQKCSGSLINNTCESLIPYFLTGFHCIDEDGSGNISGTESGQLGSWIFRFKYESPNPSGSNNCQGDQPTGWISYSGAQFRAGWADSDFGLIELNGSLIGQNELSLGGWDRRDLFPTSSECIHHPEGDVKKISYDYDAPISYLLPNKPTGYPDWFQLTFDDGIVEYVSSGAPMLNPSYRIVGQQFGINDPSILCENSNMLQAFFPRLFHSWTGGGTPDTRLSDWLDPTGTGATTVDGVRIPSITTSSSSGITHLLCEDDELTALLDISIGGEVTWEAVPHDMFRYSSGTGTSATVTPSTGYFYIQTNNTCGLSPLSNGEVSVEYPESFVLEETSSEPNSQGEFIFTIPESYRLQTSTWQILNLQGQLLMQEQVTSSRVIIPSQQLSSGIYLIRFISESGQQTRRIRISN